MAYINGQYIDDAIYQRLLANSQGAAISSNGMMYTPAQEAVAQATQAMSAPTSAAQYVDASGKVVSNLVQDTGNPTQMLAEARATQQKKEAEWEAFLASKPEWQRAFYMANSGPDDTLRNNIAFGQKADGSIYAVRSSYGGDAIGQINYGLENPETGFETWDYDPAAGKSSGYNWVEPIDTTGNEYAPYFLAAGTLLTGGMLAPVAMGAGIAGGAALGAGLGGASSALGQQIGTGSVDISKVGTAAALGGVGGAVSSGLTGMLSGADTAAASSGAWGTLADAARNAASSPSVIGAVGNSAGAWGALSDAARGAAGSPSVLNAVNGTSAWGQLSDAAKDAASDPSVIDALKSSSNVNWTSLLRKAAMQGAKSLLGGTSSQSNPYGNIGSGGYTPGNSGYGGSSGLSSGLLGSSLGQVSGASTGGNIISPTINIAPQTAFRPDFQPYTLGSPTMTTQKVDSKFSFLSPDLQAMSSFLA